MKNFKTILLPIFKTYWNYLKYIINHKKYAFIECLKTGQIIHAFTHDLSKLLPSEFFPYAEKFFSGDHAYKFFEVEYNFEKAWLLHQHRNKHHWDYWVNSDGKAIEMPKKYIKQMIADWNAVGKIKNDNTKDFYKKIKSTMKLHSMTIINIEKLLEI